MGRARTRPVWAIIAGGGTGGHVVPALAIGRALVDLGHEPSSIRFVGSRRGIESTMVPAAGFELTLLETGPFREAPKPEQAWVRHLLERYELQQDLRGDGIYAVGRKTGAVRVRYPAWLYQ